MPESPQSVDLPLFSDDPLDPSELTRFGHQAWVDRATGAVSETASNSKSAVLAIVGPWGSGKTSLLRAIQERVNVEAADGWIVIQFDPWNYQDPESLRLGFFREVHHALKGSPRFQNSRNALASFLDFAAPFANFGGSFIGVPASSGILKQISKATKSEKTATQLKTTVESHLKDHNVRILMVMDDVDRLETAELTEIFRIVRSLGNIDGFYYLLSYDEQSLLDAISNSLLVSKLGEPEEVRSRARTYIEKIVQVRLPVPPMRPAQTDYLHDLWVWQRLTDMEVDISTSASTRYRGLYRDHLRPMMTTPRIIRAYATQIAFSLPPMLDEVDLVDFMATRWIQVRFPDSYAALPSALRDTLQRWQQSLASHGDNGPRGQLASALTEALARRGIHKHEVELVVALLIDLRDGITWEEGRGRIGPHMGVWQPAYVEKFFSTTPPPEQLSQAEIRNTINRVSSSGSSGDDAVQLNDWLRKEPWVAMEALDRWASPHISTHGRNHIAVWLSQSYELVGSQPDRDFINSPALNIVTSAARFCMAGEGAHAYSALRSLTDASHLLACEVLGRVTGPHSTFTPELERHPGFPDDGLDDLSQILWPHVREVLRVPLEILDDPSWRLFWSYFAWAPDRIQSYISDTESPWHLADFLARLVNVDDFNLGRFDRGLSTSTLNEVRKLFPREMQYLIEGPALSLPTPPIGDDWENRRTLGCAIANSTRRNPTQ